MYEEQSAADTQPQPAAAVREGEGLNSGAPLLSSSSATASAVIVHPNAVAAPPLMNQPQQQLASQLPGFSASGGGGWRHRGSSSGMPGFPAPSSAAALSFLGAPRTMASMAGDVPVGPHMMAMMMTSAASFGGSPVLGQQQLLQQMQHLYQPSMPCGAAHVTAHTGEVPQNSSTIPITGGTGWAPVPIHPTRITAGEAPLGAPPFFHHGGSGPAAAFAPQQQPMGSYPPQQLLAPPVPLSDVSSSSSAARGQVEAGGHGGGGGSAGALQGPSAT